MDEYISKEAVFDEIRFQRELAESDGEASVVDTCDAMLHNLRKIETADVQPVKHEQRIDYEKLIGIFGTLCDYMVDNGRCDVFCPYAETKDKDDECEAWRTIQKIRQEG